MRSINCSSLIKYSVFEFLPEKIKRELVRYSVNDISEIRFRLGCPVMITVFGVKKFLNVILNNSDIEEIVISACKNSVYSYEEQIRRGFITLDSGVRLGLSGEFVFKGEEVTAVKNFTSISIRIPHEINGFSNEFFKKIYKGGSVLVFSSPGAGKTTFIRDFCKNLSKMIKNVVVIDERNEIVAKNYQTPFNVGNTVDVLTFCDKTFGFTHAIRTLNPDVIITDELSSLSDVKAVVSAIYGGIDVVATVHANNIEDLLNREFIIPIKTLKPFNYYVLITENQGIRGLRYYDFNFNEICLF